MQKVHFRCGDIIARILLSLLYVSALAGTMFWCTAVHCDDQIAPLSIRDLLRGFSDAELAEAKKAVPHRPEPSLPAAVPREVTVCGRVFADTNGNGQLDAGEQGLPAVSVTDGEKILRTNEKGDYTFTFQITESPHCRFIVVTRPSGYKPTNSFFYRVGFADDRPKYEVNFGLGDDPLSRRDKFSFITNADSQFNTTEQMIALAKDYAQFTSTPGGPAFLATAGDLTADGTHFQWDMFDRVSGASKIPVYHGFGGHDGNDLRSTVNYELRIGPPYYSWDYGGVHFIQFVTETQYLGDQARRQDTWLRTELEGLGRDTPLIVITHYPLGAGWFRNCLDKKTKLLCQVGGHHHEIQVGSAYGIPVLLSSPARGMDWGAYSRIWRWVHVAPQGIKTELRVGGQYKRLEVVAPGPTAALGPQPLVLLAYDTARVVRSLRCRITGPDGRVHAPKLAKQGDLSWHGIFTPNQTGPWKLELEATDVTGDVWRRQHSVRVAQAKTAAPQPGEDFAWVCAGSTPRRVAQGPGADLYPLWVKHTGSVHVLHASPVVANGRVYVAVTNPNAGTPGAGVLCLDAKTGKELWRAKSPQGNLRGPVTVHKGIVYALSNEGWIASWCAESGRLLWSRPLKSAYEHGRTFSMLYTPPVPTPHGLLVSDYNKPQYLLDYDSGKQLAQFDATVSPYASFPAVFDDVLYCTCRGGNIALKVPSGEVLWKTSEPSRTTSGGAMADGKFLYTTWTGLKAVEPSTGKTLWETPVANVGNQRPLPVVWDDLVLVNGTDFVAVDLKTGKRRWTVACAQDRDRFLRSRRQAMAGSSWPIVAATLAYFGHDDTSLRAVDHEGKVVWEHRLGTPIKTAPAVCGNLLFVHDYAGNMWCFVAAAR